MKPPRAIDKFTERGVRDHTEQVNKVLSNISFGQTVDNKDLSQNMDGWWASVTTPGSANTEFTVPHGLGRVPVGFLIFSRTKAGTTYKSTTAWTTSNIYLKDDQTSDPLVIFIV